MYGVAFKGEGDRMNGLPKQGDLVELLRSVVAFEDQAANKYTTLPKGKVGLVTRSGGLHPGWTVGTVDPAAPVPVHVGCTFLVLIDGHEYAIGDDSLGVLQGASE